MNLSQDEMDELSQFFHFIEIQKIALPKAIDDIWIRITIENQK